MRSVVYSTNRRQVWTRLVLVLFVVAVGSSSRAAKNAVIFSACSLRLHDNPLLHNTNIKESLPIFLGDDAATMDCAPALSSLSRQLAARFGLNLVMCKSPEELTRTMETHAIETFVHSSEHAEAASAASVGITSIAVHDSLLLPAEEARLRETLSAARKQADLSYSVIHDDLYGRDLPQRVPLPDSSLLFLPTDTNEVVQRGPVEGEELGLQLVRDYLALGEAAFTVKYRELYISSMSRSEEHRRSLSRLASESYCRGEVLSGLLAPLISQGCVSPRLLIHARSTLSPNEPPADSGFLDRILFGCQLKNEAIRKHWHASLSAAALQLSKQQGDWEQSFDLWRGYTFRWGVMRPPSGTKAESESRHVFILLHGFGGSVDQFTGLARELAKLGHTSIAIDSLGFGLCEKPPLSFNQYLWRDQIVEFLQVPAVKDVMNGRNVVLVGNSIGGFCAASCASVLKESCAGVVLVNSAGRVIEEDPNPTEEKETADANFLFDQYAGPSPFILSIFGKVIFSLLQPNIRKTTEWLYPTNPGLVTSSGLDVNILRDSQDPGASEVIAAGGKLPPSRSMNALFSDYNGPVLIAQGALDPLNDAPTRAAMFGRIRPNIKVELLASGHCAHDETPDLVAQAIDRWVS